MKAVGQIAKVIGMLERADNWSKGYATSLIKPGGGWGATYHASQWAPVPKGWRGPVARDLQRLLQQAAGKRGFPWESAPYVLRAITLYTGKPMSLVAFNDARRTNIGDIVKVLEIALDLVKKDEKVLVKF